MRFIPVGSIQVVVFEDWTNRVMSARDDLGVGGSNPGRLQELPHLR
jgi:hypothetical protein